MRERWFDRRFELGLDASALPGIVVRLRSTPGRSESALSPAELRMTALHPRLRQSMSVADLSFFVAEHDDHHLAKIEVLVDQN